MMSGLTIHIFHLCLVLLALAIQTASAKETVVFVHGLAGFGPDELGPIQYWSYKTRFPSKDFDTFEATVGPLSSNWDRACELYAQIKGTRVDYGLAHSTKYGHNRYGKDYTGKGFFEEWSSINRIHFVGHSMGGNTIRLLEILLQEGDAEEVAASGAEASPLFTGQGNWIKSITTFAAPHDGTPLVTLLDKFGLINLIEDIIVGFAAVSSITFINFLYDFDLDQWGISYQPGESLSSYWDRVKSSNAFNDNNEDFAFYDLSPEGCRKLNNKGKQAYPNTYYFGYATEQTYPFWSVGFFNPEWIQLPELDMWFIFHPTAALLGGRGTKPEFRKNDGLVPHESSKCPKDGNGYGGCTEYKGTWTPGKWYWQTEHFDHLQIIGFTFGYYFVVDDIYSRHANRLAKTLGFSILAADSDLSSQNDSAALVPGGVAVALGGALVIMAMVLAAVSHARARSAERLANAIENYVHSPAGSQHFSSRRGSTFNSIRASSLGSVFGRNNSITNPMCGTPPPPNTSHTPKPADMEVETVDLEP